MHERNFLEYDDLEPDANGEAAAEAAEEVVSEMSALKRRLSISLSEHASTLGESLRIADRRISSLEAALAAHDEHARESAAALPGLLSSLALPTPTQPAQGTSAAPRDDPPPLPTRPLEPGSIAWEASGRGGPFVLIQLYGEPRPHVEPVLVRDHPETYKEIRIERCWVVRHLSDDVLMVVPEASIVLVEPRGWPTWLSRASRWALLLASGAALGACLVRGFSG